MLEEHSVGNVLEFGRELKSCWAKSKGPEFVFIARADGCVGTGGGNDGNKKGKGIISLGDGGWNGVDASALRWRLGGRNDRFVGEFCCPASRLVIALFRDCHKLLSRGN